MRCGRQDCGGLEGKIAGLQGEEFLKGMVGFAGQHFGFLCIGLMLRNLDASGL